MDIAYFREENASLGGNHGYIQLHPGTAIPYLTITALISICGTLGNILVICAVLLEKELRLVGNLFIVNLAVADLCVTAFVDPFSIVGIVKGESWFTARPGLCNLIACVCLTSCFCSMLSIGAICLNRYIHICHWPWYNKIFTFQKTIAMCVGLWVVSFLADMPNFLGWGDHVYDKKTLSCLWDRTVDLSYSIFFSIFGVAIPLVVILIIYAMIYRHLRKRNCTMQLVYAAAKMAGRTKLAIEDHTWMVFICFIAFAICWLPYAIVVVFDYEDVFPHQLHLYAILIAHTNSSLNSILYGVSNEKFRQAYFHLLGLRRYAPVPKSENGTESITLPTLNAEPAIVDIANEPMVIVDGGNIKKKKDELVKML